MPLLAGPWPEKALLPQAQCSDSEGRRPGSREASVHEGPLQEWPTQAAPGTFSNQRTPARAAGRGPLNHQPPRSSNPPDSHFVEPFPKPLIGLQVTARNPLRCSSAQ